MPSARWTKAISLLVLVHLPLVAALVYYAPSSRSTPSSLPSTLLRRPAPSLPAPIAPAAAAPPIIPTFVPVALAAAPGREREASGLPPSPPDLAATAAGLPSPLQQNASAKEFIEGHWLGLEVIPLTPELAKEYRIPEGEQGILVDEVTLEAAESGILAGDMVHSIEGRLTPDLREFFLATQAVRQRGQATVEVGRRGRTLSFTMSARNASELGFAQMEAAQPIVPGSISPHRTRNSPCTTCHVIMASGGQLPTDAGDILPTPRAIVEGSVAPHRYRGPCSSCHQLTASGGGQR